ncbi:MAG TPA: TlpA disulfide reductase family protein [Bacteroidota bacterium]|jgi:thiol-disulfide isomerase/thioredoxin
MMRIHLRSVVFTFVLLFVLISGCARREARTAGTQPPATGGTVADVMNVVKRPEHAPNFSWKDSAGKTIDFDSFHGKVTFINFWATWCGPCKKELPDLVALSRELASRDVRFIGVSTDRGPNIIEDVRSFVTEQGIPYPIVISNDDLEEAFGSPRAIPTSFIVDADGKIAKTIVGLQSKKALTDAITAVLK